MDIDQYLQRICFSDTINTDITTLEKLQHHHLLHIPFEDLDIYYKLPIMLDTQSIYEKIVLNKRGGYCYELNSLFYELLTATGFKPRMVSCRVANAKGYGAEYDHMALVVTLEGKDWLVDVGYGDFSLKPLAITPGVVQNDGRNNYIITDNINLDGKKYMSVGRWNGTRKLFVPEYIFTLAPQKLAAFTEMNHYQQTNPQSHFVRTLMCSLPTPSGRVSIVNNNIIETINGIKRTKHIKDDKHRQLLLKRYFDIQFHCPVSVH